MTSTKQTALMHLLVCCCFLASWGQCCNRAVNTAFDSYLINKNSLSGGVVCPFDECSSFYLSPPAPENYSNVTVDQNCHPAVKCDNHNGQTDLPTLRVE